MPLLQMIIALVFLLFIVVGSLRDRAIRSTVQQLERHHFVLRGDVTGEYGRSTYGRTFEKLIWACIKHRSSAEQVGIIEKRETLWDWLKTTCRDFGKKAYWKMKFEQLLEISRAEHTMLGIIWPVEDELVYFTRTQRLVSYYCGMMITVCVGVGTCALIKTDHSACSQKYSLRLPWWLCIFAPPKRARREARALLRWFRRSSCCRWRC